MAIKILVDCIHNSGKISVSSRKRPDMSYSLARGLCEAFANDDRFSAFLNEDECIDRYGSDSIKGRISVAGDAGADCYICFHSNPSGRYRGCGVAAHIRRGDETAGRLAEGILSAVSEKTSLNPIGIYHGGGLMLGGAVSHPVILELAFNPYSSAFTAYRQELAKLSGAVCAGITSVFDSQVPSADADFQDFLDQNTEIGFIKVWVLAGRSDVPVPESKVVVSKTIGDKSFVLAEVSTDVNGMTSRLSLPAPPAYLSMSPGNPGSYSSYDIRVSHPSYQEVTDRDVPVFDGVLSIQNVQLNSLLPEGRV